MKQIIKILIPNILIGLLISINLFLFFSTTEVDGYSMNPNINDGDFFLLSKITHDIKRNDVIVFTPKCKNELYIKRVIGLPNEEVVIKNNNIYINEKIIEDTYGFGSLEEYNGFSMKLKKDEYFVLGDNRKHSEDSRFYTVGAVNKKSILGKTILKLN